MKDVNVLKSNMLYDMYRFRKSITIYNVNKV